jgi:hypothetical protein
MFAALPDQSLNQFIDVFITVSCAPALLRLGKKLIHHPHTNVVAPAVMSAARSANIGNAGT